MNFDEGRPSLGRQQQGRRHSPPVKIPFNICFARQTNILNYTYTEIISSLAHLIAAGAISSRIARQLLLLTSASAEERLVQGGDNGITLQLSVTGRVGSECDVSLILQEWVVPAANKT